MIEDIKAKINDSIITNFLDVIDESPNHSNYSGQLSHVKIIIASNDFKEKNCCSDISSSIRQWVYMLNKFMPYQ